MTLNRVGDKEFLNTESVNAPTITVEGNIIEAGIPLTDIPAGTRMWVHGDTAPIGWVKATGTGFFDGGTSNFIWGTSEGYSGAMFLLTTGTPSERVTINSNYSGSSDQMATSHGHPRKVHTHSAGNHKHTVDTRHYHNQSIYTDILFIGAGAGDPLGVNTIDTTTDEGEKDGSNSSTGFVTSNASNSNTSTGFVGNSREPGDPADNAADPADQQFGFKWCRVFQAEKT